MEAKNVENNNYNILSKSNKGEKKNIMENNTKEKKISNINVDEDTYIQIFDAFAKVLSEIKIEQGVQPNLLSKLLDTQKLINDKLNLLTSGKGFASYGKNILLHGSNRSLSNKSFYGSSESLQSVASVKVEKDSYENFLKRVNCPFCSEQATDEFQLVSHLDHNCKVLDTKSFKKASLIPFSAFQILPNNTFKCNLCHDSCLHDFKQLFAHMERKNHIILYELVAEKKNCTEFLFCSCCKILVPNNDTQLKFHLNQEKHKQNRCGTFSKLPNNVSYVYNNKKKFKCKICPRCNTFNTYSEFLQHLAKKTQFHQDRGNPEKVYCEFCKENLSLLSFAHYQSPQHMEKEIAASAIENFESCFYCGFTCQNLTELSQHMISKCQKIKEIRETFSHSENKKVHNNSNVSASKPIPQKKKKTIAPKKKKDDLSIYAKGFQDLNQYQDYFKKFSNVKSVSKYSKEIAKVEFSKASSVEKILLLKDLVEMDSNLKIGHSPQFENSITASDSNADYDTSFLDDEGTNSNSDSTNDSEEESDFSSEDCNNPSIIVKQVQEFLRDSISFPSSLETDDRTVRIKTEIVRILNCIDGTLVGFQGCGLPSFHKRFDFYCEFDSEILHEKLKEEFLPLSVSKAYHCQMVKRNYEKLRESDLWTDVQLNLQSSFPNIFCTFKATQEICCITFMESAKLLTDIFRECVTVPKWKSFVVAVQSWVKYQNLQFGKTDYPLMSLIAYFLIRHKNLSVSLEGTEIHRKLLSFVVKASPENSKVVGKDSLREVFKEFMNFLISFDFQNDAICLPLPYPVPKELLVSEWFQYITSILDAEPIKKPELCIMDPYCRLNVALDVDKSAFKRVLKSVAAVLQIL